MMKNLFSRIFHNQRSQSEQRVEQKMPAGIDLPPFPELTYLIGTYDRESHAPDVFCMGDSVWERLSRDDVDQRNIGQMLRDALHNTLDVAFITHSAYNLRIYLNLIKALERMKNRPGYMVLPINLRSFSPQWFLNPLWQFARENQVLEEYYASPEMNIPVIEPVVEYPGLYNSFDATPVNYPLSEFKTVREFRELIASVPVEEEHIFFRIRQIFVFHYMHPLVETHPLLQYLDEALRRLAEMKTKTFVYITPINHQAGLRFCGEDFLTRVALNTRTVYEVVARHQVEGLPVCKDYGTLLPSEYFFHPDNATEHLNESGRHILVEQLKSELISMME